MDSRFRALVEGIETTRLSLLSMPPFKYDCRPAEMPRSGIYLFSESGRHLYVGRSNNMRGRLRNHGRPSANENQAAFAFKLAREATGELGASYKTDGSRKDLMGRPKFGEAFEAAKKRLRAMEIRVVEESDPTKQALLEIYCAFTLNTPYNDFDNH